MSEKRITSLNDTKPSKLYKSCLQWLTQTFIFPFQFDITNNMSLLRRLIFKSYFLIEVKARHCQKILFCNAIFLKIKNTIFLYTCSWSKLISFASERLIDLSWTPLNFICQTCWYQTLDEIKVVKIPEKFTIPRNRLYIFTLSIITFV